uniref:Photosystem I reaction center subunit PsaK n=1 Tax=Ophidocladus simpliciusculus TaxID=1261574 RepID=A0A1Z1MIS4_9FLOR|nr:photosystem I reaction center subunit X [Ophidocladus simpliciusculus]ARW65953.1 photosystem I reaction center subunit X [Ophidocladus simpliciusculus]
MHTNNIFEIISTNNIWSVKISIIMIICNLISIGIGRYAIKIRGLGPSIPLLGSKGLGLPELLATTSLGHILGAGTIIGLRGIGFLI